MGIPPTDDSVIPAIDPNPACEVAIFGGETPRFITVHFFDVIACPPKPDNIILPNGTWRIEQTFEDEWRGVAAGVGVNLILQSNFSELTGGFADGPAFFSSQSGQPCKTLYRNTLTCSPHRWASQGWGQLIWGPGL